MNKIIISSIILILLDSIYLKLTSSFFNKQIFMIQKSNIKLDMLSAVICYLFLILGLNYFILSENKSLFDAFILGLVIYMVFDTTNKAIFKKWKWETVIMDGIWGGLLFLMTTLFTYKLT